MNHHLVKIGLDSGMLNYVDNETPRNYFLAHWADEYCLEDFANRLVKEVLREVEQQIFWNGIDVDNNPRWYKAVERTQQQFGIEVTKEHE